MRNLLIGIGISLIFCVGLVAQASAQKCWDLDGSGSCDLFTEDINQDGKCNNRDCQQGEPVISGVHVYDANLVDLGLLVGHEFSFRAFLQPVYIFIPSINMTILIDKGNGYVIEDGFGPTELYYKTLDCSGTAFVAYPRTHFVDIILETDSCVSFNYFMLRSGRQNIVAYSQIINDCTKCIPIPAGESLSLYEVIEVPESEIPFELPVALPLRYKYGSE